MLWISRNYKSAVHDASHSPAELSGGVAVKCRAQVEKNNKGDEEGEEGGVGDSFLISTTRKESH